VIYFKRFTGLGEPANTPVLWSFYAVIDSGHIEFHRNTHLTRHHQLRNSKKKAKWKVGRLTRSISSSGRLGEDYIFKCLLLAPIQVTLFFPGEATDFNGHHGTVHDAITSGQRASAELLSPKPPGILHWVQSSNRTSMPVPSNSDGSRLRIEPRVRIGADGRAHAPSMPEGL
jgi:hypothetical protein